MTSPKIREYEAIAGWFTLVAWLATVVLSILIMLKEWLWTIPAFSILVVGVFIAFRAHQEVKDCKVIAKTLDKAKKEKVKALYGK